MKEITVAIIYKAYVPEDMEVAEIAHKVESYFEREDTDFRINVKSYHNENKAEPLFEFNNVSVGDNMTIIITNSHI